MKIKILITFFSVIYSVAASTDQRLKLKKQSSSIELTAKQQANVADRKLKARQAFEALPVDTSFDDLLGPTPPERKHSQILRSGSLKTKKSFVSDDDDRGMAAPPIAIHDFVIPKQTVPSADLPAFSMKEWLAASDSSFTSAKNVGDKQRAAAQITAGDKKIVPAVVGLSGDTSTTKATPIVASDAQYLKSLPPLRRFAAAARVKAQQAKAAVRKVVLTGMRSAVSKIINDNVTAVITKAIQDAGGDVAAMDVAKEVNAALKDEFGTTLADYHIPEKLAKKLTDGTAVGAGVEAITDRILPSVGGQVKSHKTASLKVLLKTKLADAKKTIVDKIKKSLQEEIETKLTELINKFYNNVGGDVALEKIIAPVDTFLKDELKIDANVKQLVADKLREKATAEAVHRVTDGVLSRETVVRVIRGAGEAKAAMRNLAHEMGLTAELKAQMKAEVASFKASVIGVKQSAEEAIAQLRLRTVPEE